MGRVLFVVPPFEAHVNPVVSIERALAARGHATAYVAHESMRQRLPHEAHLYALQADPPDFREELARNARLPWILGMRALIERILMPLAAQMQAHVDAAIAQFSPGAVVADQHAYAGAFAARKAGVRFATSAPSALLLEPGVFTLDGVRAWWDERLSQAQREAGLADAEATDVSPDLVLLYVSRELAGADRTFPASYRFVGPAYTGRADDTPFPWERLRDGPRLLVSFGTILTASVGSFYAKLVDALDGAPLQVIVSAPASSVPREPANFIVVPRVPMMALLPRVDAVLCHGGSTANEALAHGLPVVLAPISQDQPTYARLACEAGAGIQIRVLRVTPDALRTAVTQALHDPQMRESARRVQASFAAAGGASAAADAVETLLAG